MIVNNPNEVLGLREYINKHFDGCQTAFAKSSGKHLQHINRQLQSCTFIVVDGNVCQIKYSVKPVNAESPS